LKVVSFKIDEDLLWLALKKAEKEGISFSELMRRALKFYIDNYPPGKRVIATRKIKVYL
jgi:hypothetical protein